MSLTKMGAGRWLLVGICGNCTEDSDDSVDFYINATKEGLEIDGELISWEEIEAAKKSAQ